MRASLSLSISLALAACCLSACSDDGGVAGTGGGGATSGSGGSSATGGDGGSAGVGGSAGSAGIDAGLDASHDANVGAVLCDDDAGTTHTLTPGWFAEKTTLDVWWQGRTLLDPGRADVAIYTLSHVEPATGDGDALQATIKVCGITLPPFTDDVRCEAHQLAVDNDAWESANTPRFVVRSDNGTVPDLGVTALLGIDLADPTRPWPSSDMIDTIVCDDGTGQSCFPDHDGDTFPGITASFRMDQALYVGPYGDGECTSGRPYIYRGQPLGFYCAAGSCPANPPNAAALHLGLRTALRTDSAACDAASIFMFDARSTGCAADPTSLFPSLGPGLPADPRIASMDYTCTADEAKYVDDTLPSYRVLRTGERPGDSTPQYGWTVNNRDIDKRASAGTRSITRPLGQGEPSCAQVRAVLAND